MPSVITVACAALLALSPLFPTLPAKADTMLRDLARQVPGDAVRPVRLVDIGMRRSVVERIWPGRRGPDGLAAPYQGTSIQGLVSVEGLVGQADRFEATHGFAFAAIDGIGTWGVLPDVATLVRGPGVTSRPWQIESALWDRGFDTRDLGARRVRRSKVAGVPVWFRGEDHSFDPDRADEDWFTGGLGQPVRLAVKDDTLWATQTWPMMTRALFSEDRLTDNPDVAALLDAIEAQRGFGDPSQVVFYAQQPFFEDTLPKTLPDAALIHLRDLRRDQSQVPAFESHALAEWMDGTVLTEAILMSFDDKGLAEAAVAVMTTRFRDAMSPRTMQPLSEMFRASAEGRVLSAGGRFVAMLSVTRNVVGASDLVSTPLALNGGPFQTLQRLAMFGEIAILIGR